MQACEICGNIASNKIHTAREMMFGLRHRFEYLECGDCGCVQLLNPPANMADYYPRDYYSYQQHGWLMTLVRRRWAAYACGAKSLIGWFVNELICPNNAIAAVHRLNLPKDTRILELGSGSGRLLQDLAHFGFKRLQGADPFIEHDLVYDGGVTVHKQQYHEITGEFDLIMLHHAFEHMSQPRATIQGLARLLASNGTVILRIPVAASYGWRHYGINWVHLDAPRHLFLHTFKSLDILATQAGLTITSLIHEAEEISITGSEAYVRDIPLCDSRCPLANIRTRLLGWRRRQQNKQVAAGINQRGEADMVCFYLKKAELDILDSAVESPR
jgi:SAM-dependent methyltransferase